MRHQYLGMNAEMITVEYEGQKYSGIFKIQEAGGEKYFFIVSFREMYHKDMSLFKYGSEGQMKIHVKFVLKDLIKALRKDAKFY